MKTPSRLGILLLACAMSLGGCASKYGTQTTNVNYFPQCYEPINQLRATEQSYTSSVGGGVLLGSLLGAVTGYLATGKTGGAVAGAVAGGAVGGAVGYGQAQKRENRDMANYLSQLEGDISNLDSANAAGRVALQCYDKSFNSSLRDFKAKRMSRAEFDARYNEIRSGSEEALRIMRSQASKASEKEAQYQEALRAEAAAANRPVPVQAPAPKKSASKSSKSSPKPSKSAAKSGDSLTQMAEQTQAYSKSRSELESDIATGEAMRTSWSQDLAAIRS